VTETEVTGIAGDCTNTDTTFCGTGLQCDSNVCSTYQFEIPLLGRKQFKICVFTGYMCMCG